MTLTNAQRPLDIIEVDPAHIIGLRRRADGSTVILQNVQPTHLHVQETFETVLQMTIDKKEGFR